MWRDDRFNHSCQYYDTMDKSADWTRQELDEACESDISDIHSPGGARAAIQACLLSCKSKKCSHECHDSLTWRSKDHGLPCSAYSKARLNHRFCAVDHDRHKKLARDACPFSCETCPSGLANLDDPPPLLTALLCLLVIAPTFIRLLEVLGTAHDAVRKSTDETGHKKPEPGCCCCCPERVRRCCDCVLCAPPWSDDRESRPEALSGGGLPGGSQPEGRQSYDISLEVADLEEEMDDEELEFMRDRKLSADVISAGTTDAGALAETPPYTLGVDVVWARQTAYHHFAFETSRAVGDQAQPAACAGACQWARAMAVARRRSRRRGVNVWAFAMRRLVTWHVMQPLIYCCVLGLYWEALDDKNQQAQRVAAYAVLLREALHSLLALGCLSLNPLFVLVDLRDTLDYSEHAWDKVAVMVFAPWAFTLRALLGQPEAINERWHRAGTASRPQHQLRMSCSPPGHDSAT